MVSRSAPPVAPADTRILAIEQVKELLRSDVAFAQLAVARELFDVRDNTHYRKRGIDLIAAVRRGGFLEARTIEVRGEVSGEEPRLFLETARDAGANTVDAFLACEADWLLYSFVNLQRTVLIEMRSAKPWFARNQARFPERQFNVEREERACSTMGRVVPLEALTDEVAGAIQFLRASGVWTRVVGDEGLAPSRGRSASEAGESPVVD